MQKIYLLLIILSLPSCSTSSFVDRIPERQKLLCIENRPAYKSSLTIYAYNNVPPGSRIDLASEDLRRLNSQYDFLVKKVIPQVLLSNNLEVKNSITFNNKQGKNLFDYYRTRRIVNFDTLSFIATSSTGDELAICPTELCSELSLPNDKIIKRVSRDGAFFYETNENPYEVLDPIPYKFYSKKKLNKPSSFYFLFDILAKSGLSLGTYYQEHYFVVPEIEQSKLCNDIKTILPYHPESCFTFPFKTKDDYQKYISDNWTGSEWKAGKTNLTSSPAFKCCAKENDRFCNNTGGQINCNPSEMDKTLYMDAVTRDLIEKVSFEIEKKNLGKWTIYKININPELLCSSGRNKNELRNN